MKKWGVLGGEKHSPGKNRGALAHTLQRNVMVYLATPPMANFAGITRTVKPQRNFLKDGEGGKLLIFQVF